MQPNQQRWMREGQGEVWGLIPKEWKTLHRSPSMCCAEADCVSVAPH